MNLRWTSVTSGLIVGAALGFVFGHVSALSRMASPQPVDRTVKNQLAEPPSFPSVVDLAPDPIDDADHEPVYFPEIQRLADAAPDISIPRPPATLPNAADAVPIDPDHNASGIRALIDAELRDATPQQREVWSDVLGGLPPEDALGILQLWRSLGTPPSAALGSYPTRLKQPPAPADGEAPGPGPASAANDDETALRAWRTILLGNLLNAQTVGFRRIEPLLSDRRAGTGPVGVRLTGTRIDPSQGEIVETGRSLDVALEGTGFFIVLDEDREVFTRCGRLELDGERRLSVRAGDKVLPLHPEIRLPKDVQAIEVKNNGEVSITVASGAATSVGRIRTATFLDAHALQPLGAGLLADTAGSGAAHGDPSGQCIVVQRALEQSNVDPDEEQQQLDRIDDLLSQLATAR